MFVLKLSGCRIVNLQRLFCSQKAAVICFYKSFLVHKLINFGALKSLFFPILQKQILTFCYQIFVFHPYFFIYGYQSSNYCNCYSLLLLERESVTTMAAAIKQCKKLKQRD